MKKITILIFLIITFVIISTPLYTATVTPVDRKITLSWTLNKEEDMSIYRVYKSNKRGTYNISNVVATVDKSINKVNLVIPNDGRTYFFIVTALDKSGKESLYSNEVSTRLLVFDWFFGMFSLGRDKIVLAMET